MAELTSFQIRGWANINCFSVIDDVKDPCPLKHVS